jgi:endo-1,4-beta-xylanase
MNAISRILTTICATCLLTFSIVTLWGQTPTLNNDSSLKKLVSNIRPNLLIGSFSAGLNTKEENLGPGADFFKNNFNIITVGVYMTSTQPQPEGYRFEATDKLIDFARANKMKVYLHPVIGGPQYSPDWIDKGTQTKVELYTIMENRINTIFTRYKAKVDYADVVNEPLNYGKGMDENGNFIWSEKIGNDDHVWMQKLGMYQGKKHQFPRYLVDAFRISRKYGGKKVKLILNEYDNSMLTSPNGMAFFELVKALREEGIPVDGAGLQLHTRIKDGILVEGKATFDFASFDAMLKLYEKAGIDVHITEFDMHLPVEATAEDFALQGKYYAEILKHAMASPAVKSFKTWGFTDKESWRSKGTDDQPLMLDHNFKTKPAYIKMIEMLKNSKFK